MLVPGSPVSISRVLGWIKDAAHRKAVLRFIQHMPHKEELAFKLLPYLTLEIIRKYFRVESEGFEHLPKKGGAILFCNHSGYAGFDAVMLAHEVQKKTKRSVRPVAHKLWFMGEHIKTLSKKMGLVEASYEACLKQLQKGKILLLFPEGENGNFKPTHRRYHLQKFRRGFIRLALETGVPLIPAHIIGAEETHINLTQLKITKKVLGIITPVPLNLIPLPAKWRIKIHPPENLDLPPETLNQQEKITALSAAHRRNLQRKIIADLRQREFVFID